MMPVSRRCLALLAAVATLFLGGCGLSLAEDITPPPNYRPPEQSQQETTPQPVSASTVFPIVPPDPESGRKIYEEDCLPCHGETGMGDGPMAGNLPSPAPAIGAAEVARRAKPVDWFAMVTNGNLENFMPGFAGSLNDRQRWDVVAYVYSLSTNAETLAQGQAIYTENCAACHGEDGFGDGPEAANQPVKPASWTETSRLARLSADDIVGVFSGANEEHTSSADELSEAQRYAVAGYVRSLSFARDSGPAASGSENPEGTTGEARGEQPSGEAAAPEKISIQGTVTNATPGGSIPENLKVNLAAFQGMASAYEIEAQVNPDGSYVFENVDFDPEYVYFVRVNANGLTFNSDILHGRDVAGEVAELPIKIYDTTSDTAFLKADRLHVFFDFSNPGIVQVVELFIISNPSDKVVVAREVNGPVLTFDIPPQAQNLQFENGTLGDRFIQTGDGFGDRMSIPPGMGQHQVLFAYELPYNRGLDLNITTAIPVDAAVVMIPPSGVKLRSSQLQDAGPYDMQGMSFQMYQAVNSLAAGESIQVNLSGRATDAGAAGAQEPNEMLFLIIGLGVFGAVLAGAGLWLYFQHRSRNLATVEGELLEEDAPAESSETILDAIVALDDLHASGGLPEAAYQERRSELKSRLADALEHEKGESV